jgi:hypothetical protein
LGTQLKIYCDTNTLPHNIGHASLKSLRELVAIKQLADKYPVFHSLVTYKEVMATPGSTRRRVPIIDYNALNPIPKDEKIHGFHTEFDPYGGCVTYPLVSDVQDEALCEELKQHGLSSRDAEHITQAVCNRCDVFLTRDEATIIKPHRTWLERRFPTLKFRLPSELLEQLASSF